jgi:glycosyltransferase involved in cell wall biosynthesis
VNGPRRVLVVAPQPFYEDRGTPIAARHVIEALSESGYLVDLATFPVGRPISIPNLTIHRAANPLRIRRVPVGFSLRKIVLDLALAPQIARLIRRHRYHAIHALQEGVCLALPLGRAAGIPVVYDVQSSLADQMVTHGIFRLPPAQWVLRRIERVLLARADRVVPFCGLAPQLRARAPTARIQEWPAPAGLERATPAAVASLRNELGLANGAPVVVYTGTFEPYQGLPMLLAAIPAIRAAVPDAVFVLVGRDPAQSVEVDRLVAALPDTGAVRIVPRQPRQTIPAYLALATVLVSPRAYGDNLPLKIFDYLAAGIPIVATDIAAHRALLDSTRAEMPQPTGPSLERALVRVLTDKDHAAQLGANARAYAAEHLSWGAYRAAVAELYDGLRPSS